MAPAPPTDPRQILRGRPDPGTYVANAAGAELDYLEHDGRLVPLVVNHASCDRCYLVSPKAQYLDYALSEVGSLESAPLRWAVRAAAAPVQALLRVRPLDRVVYAGHWLLPTNPPQPWDAAGVEHVKAHVAERYPGYALVVRNLDAYAQGDALDLFQAHGFRLQLSREVHWFLPDRKLSRGQRDNIRGDLALFKRYGYTEGDGEDLRPDEVETLWAYYRDLYVVKHSPYNADYTAAWFRAALGYGPLRVRTVRLDGRVVAFAFSLRHGGRAYPSVVGYDPAPPREASPYRAVVGTLVRDARAEGTPLFLSSGVSAFKKNRGTQTFYEYDAVFADGTGPLNRLAWGALRRVYGAAADRVYAEDAI